LFLQGGFLIFLTSDTNNHEQHVASRQEFFNKSLQQPLKHLFLLQVLSEAMI